MLVCVPGGIVRNHNARRTQLSSALTLSLCCLLNLDGIVDDEVHELVKSLLLVNFGARSPHLQFPPPLIYRRAYSNLSLNSDRQLLIQPNLNRRVLLQQLEDEVDWWEKDSASTPSAWTSGHIFDIFRVA